MTLETIQGNISAEQKKLCKRLLAYFVGTSETSYGAEIGEGLKLSRIDVYPHPQATGLQDPFALSLDLSKSSPDYRNQGSLQDQTSAESLDLEARTVCEITVTKSTYQPFSSTFVITITSEGMNEGETPRFSYLSFHLSESRAGVAADLCLSEMCNVHGTLHGGCAMYLMDP